MIDLDKLENSFELIGINRIPAFIDIYLRSTHNFLQLFDKYYQKKSNKKLLNLIHKTNGSTANFFSEDMDEILSLFERKITDDIETITQEEITQLKSRFTQFCQELVTLKSRYL